MVGCSGPIGRPSGVLRLLVEARWAAQSRLVKGCDAALHKCEGRGARPRRAFARQNVSHGLKDP
eukprot:351534-Chlamydomonas_euryale.AAC.8